MNPDNSPIVFPNVGLRTPEAPKDIRHQKHYEQYNIQPITFIVENNLDFCTGNIIKYVCRHNMKNGVEDLQKAKHYLDMLISKAEGKFKI